jgi:putative ABC transport system permease protein
MLSEILKEALVSLRRNRTRSALTLLGMAWGVACFVILYAWGDGFQKAIKLGLAYFGDNVTIVWGGQTSMQAGGEKAGRRIIMELADVEDVRRGASLLRRISPEFYRTFPMQTTKRVSNDGVRGINHQYGPMRGQFIEEGRLISPEDVQFSRRVVVLGSGLREKLFSEAPAVGEDVRIGGIPFTVIGVLRKKVSLSNYFGLDDKNAFIPYTAMGSLSQIRYLSVMVVQTVNPALEEPALRQVREMLAKNHRFNPNDERALTMQTWREMDRIFGFITDGMKWFLLIMGTLTLSIGGVGLMNVMLVAVTERTREIGIRKAMGARRRHILAQFLLEGLAIAMVGGLIGYVLAEVVAWAIGVIPFWSAVMDDKTGQADIHMLVSPAAVLTAGITLTIVGLLSGFLPAFRASRLSPIEALRYE